MASVQDLDDQIGRLNITDKIHDDKQSHNLDMELQDFDQMAERLVQQLANIEKLLSSNPRMIGTHGQPIYQAYEGAKNICLKAQNLQNAVLQSVVTHITSFASETCGQTDDMLKHFDKSIKTIVKDSLQLFKHNENLWIIVENCYNQAATSSGPLNVDHYIASMPEPDTSQDVKGDKTALKEKSRDMKERWVRFWATCLNNCPGGPTLFIPPRPNPFNERMSPAKDPPKYLFRAYDSSSLGKNEDHVIASIARNRINILSQEKQQASKTLYGHLIGPYTSSSVDNLVSWSSSLLFVIQYANYKFGRKGKSLDDISICAIDTTKFPKGQFVRDKWLMERFDSAHRNKEERKFRSHRLYQPEYDNGEYLSQGTLIVLGRSCTMSLSDLYDAGVGSLYTELDAVSAEPEADVRNRWTNYVMKLRSNWNYEHPTTELELRYATEIAETCFTPLNKDDMALMLLAFRNRRLKNTGTFYVLAMALDEISNDTVKTDGREKYQNRRKSVGMRT